MPTDAEQRRDEQTGERWGARASFLAGAKAAAPIYIGIVPFGLVTGVSAVSVGIPVTETIAMSAVVFAGASQLAGIQLIANGAAFPIIWLAALVINLRFVMYSASLAPHLRAVGLGKRSFAAYLMTDQAFALSVGQFSEDDNPFEGVMKFWFYSGVALPIWVLWMITTVIGAVFGAQIPASWGLDFVIPLMFLAILMPALRDRPALVAAAVGAVVAVAADGLPFNLGLITAAVAGIVAGQLAEART
ncbi:MAG: AzlC family ABC transporter permease [Trueperaceae bacterium]|nr:AzlC family ABC transporter permease [Trueperaceae bacterium]